VSHLQQGKSSQRVPAILRKLGNDQQPGNGKLDHEFFKALAGKTAQFHGK